MTIIVLTCWSALMSVECGQYIDVDRCLRAGPYVSRVTSIEFHVRRLRWRCEERRS